MEARRIATPFNLKNTIDILHVFSGELPNLRLTAGLFLGCVRCTLGIVHSHFAACMKKPCTAMRSICGRRFATPRLGVRGVGNGHIR